VRAAGRVCGRRFQEGPGPAWEVPPRCAEATGKKSNSFDHAPFLAQCLLTATKFFSCAEGYTFGKAAALRLLLQTPKYERQIYFKFARMNGSRFADSYSRTQPLVFMHSALVDHLSTQLGFAGAMQRIVSSLWSQLTSPVLMAEARVKEAIFNHILEPLQVILGISFDMEEDGAGGAADVSAVQQLFDEVMKSNGGAAAAAAAAPPPLSELLQRVIAWRAHELGSGRRCDVADYRGSFSEEERDQTADELQARNSAGVQRDVARMVKDGDPSNPAVMESTHGALHELDVLVRAIDYIEDLAENNPMEIFSSARASDVYAGWGGVVGARLEAWESYVYKKAGRNASGKVVAPSLREAMAEKREHPTDAIFLHEDAHAAVGELIPAMLTAMAKEWRKMLEHGIGGSLRPACRTEWQKDILDRVKHSTMLSESNLAAVKALRRTLGDAGAKGGSITVCQSSGRWLTTCPPRRRQ
jgi:hypothetical protein